MTVAAEVSRSGDAVPTSGAPLPAYALFAAMLASAGLPIYIHAPKVFAETYGVGLAELGLTLFGLRLLDLVQDPILGWCVSRLGRRLGQAVGAATFLLALAMAGLFAVRAPFAPLVWFGLTLAVLFAAYSFLSIAFYARGVLRAGRLGADGHLRLAGWREGGALVGVCLAAMAPTVLGAFSIDPYVMFAGLFAVLCAAAAVAMSGEWDGPAAAGPSGIRKVLADSVLRRLLALALVNAAPLAITSTLFLFFVESRLGAAGWEGLLLVLYFFCAALASPLWSRAAIRFGAKPALMTSMVLSIAVFAWAATLGRGDLMPFAAVCVLSGLMLGADLVILPAVFAKRLAIASPEGGIGFGLWSFATKFTLAFSAAILLPLLQSNGFVPGGLSPPSALTLLSVLYALAPCGLKLVAVALLAVTPFAEAAK